MNKLEKRVKDSNKPYTQIAAEMSSLAHHDGRNVIYTDSQVKRGVKLHLLTSYTLDYFLKVTETPSVPLDTDLKLWALQTDVKALRVSLGYSQPSLAKVLGITPGVICRLEKKHLEHISLHMLDKIKTFLENPLNAYVKPEKETKKTKTKKREAFDYSPLVEQVNALSISYPELANRVGIPRSSLYDILEGHIHTRSKNVAKLEEYLNNIPNEDTNFIVIRDFCINKLSTALKGRDRAALAKELGVSPSYFSKLIHSFDITFSHVTPQLQLVYDYFNTPVVESDRLVDGSTPGHEYQPEEQQVFLEPEEQSNSGHVATVVDCDPAAGTYIVETPVVAQLINYTADEVTLLTSILEEKIESLKDSLAIFLDNEQYEYAKNVIDKIEAVKALLPENK